MIISNDKIRFPSFARIEISSAQTSLDQVPPVDPVYQSGMRPQEDSTSIDQIIVERSNERRNSDFGPDYLLDESLTKKLTSQEYL